ncbi:response regulator [Streptomyces sp. NPDC098789]|uniref:response regulator n=1 Tax=Streptomyces sp. NPDC098789 TaxID=3366098 RepID=UPI00382B0B27
MIRVLLADDEALVRAGVAMVLRHAKDIEVVAEAADGEQAVALAAAERPDVALIDVRMPGTDGLAAAERIAALRPAVAVVMLSTFGDESNVVSALKCGANGFLLKDSGPQELINAVRVAAAGEAVLSPGATLHVIRKLRAGDAEERFRACESQIADLTPREREVLAMVGEGLPNAEIGQLLGVNTVTVKAHVGRIFAKARLTNRVQAALLAQRTGLAKPF